MTDDLRIWLPPMLTLLGTLIVVVSAALLNNSRLSDLRAAIDKRLDLSDRHFDVRFAGLKETMDTRFADMDARFAGLKETMDARFADLKETMDARFADLKETMDTRFAGLRETMAAEFRGVRSELLRVEQVMDTRVRHLEER